MSEGRILFAVSDNRCFVRLEGSIRHTISAGFDAFIGRLCSEIAVDDIVIDLTKATYIDSTNLGLLAKIALCVRDNLAGKATIVSQNEGINSVLHVMGLDGMFAMMEKLETPEEDYRPIPAVRLGAQKRAEVILKAHKALIHINEKNKDVFGNVVRALENELGDSPE